MAQICSLKLFLPQKYGPKLLSKCLNCTQLHKAHISQLVLQGRHHFISYLFIMITGSCAIQSWMAIDHCLSFAQSNKDIKHEIVLPFGVPVINPSDILQKWITKRRKWPTNKSSAKKSQHWKCHSNIR